MNPPKKSSHEILLLWSISLCRNKRLLCFLPPGSVFPFLSFPIFFANVFLVLTVYAFKNTWWGRVGGGEINVWTAMESHYLPLLLTFSATLSSLESLWPLLTQFSELLFASSFSRPLTRCYTVLSPLHTVLSQHVPPLTPPHLTLFEYLLQASHLVKCYGESKDEKFRPKGRVWYVRKHFNTR